MVMTKKELAETEAKIDHWRTVAALRWTEEVTPDVARPTAMHGEHTTGFRARATTYGAEVDQFWAGFSVYGTGSNPDNTPSHQVSRGVIKLHSTKIRALKALRNQLEKKAAADMLAIDKAIEALTRQVSDDPEAPHPKEAGIYDNKATMRREAYIKNGETTFVVRSIAAELIATNAASDWWRKCPEPFGYYPDIKPAAKEPK